MAKLKVDQFVDLVKRSGLVDDERLNQALSGIDDSVKDSGIIASSLTKAGLLTEWQSEKLLQGKHKGFYLGKYKLLNHLGTGGMGAVYLAEHRVMRHRVAIKLLPNYMASQSSYLERFHLEARASAQLNHPNMVRATDVDSEDNIHYLVMEYVDGTDLQALVSRNGPLPYRTAADYTRQAAEGLAYAHRSGLIHRDIKPANLLVDKTGTIKILDMGLARFSDETQSSLTMAYDQKMIGTVDYLSPEQALDSHRVDFRVDIYSLGCTLYFMLTGDAPFPQGTIPQRLMQHQSAEPTDVRKTRPDAPEDLLAICRKMMAKSANDRYQTAEDVSAALGYWLGDVEASPAAETRYAPPPGPSQNDDLTLAPLDDEPTRGARAAKPAEASGAASKSNAKGADGSGVRPDGIKPGGSAAGQKPLSSAGQKSGSSVTKNGAGSTIVRNSSAEESTVDKPRPVVEPPAPVKNLAQANDLMEELLANPTAPPRDPTQAMSGAHRARPQVQEPRPLWMAAAVGLAGAALIVGLILFLIWYTI